MPNAHDYRAAARRLRRLAVQLDHEIVVVRAVSAPARFVGGPGRAPLDDALDETVRSVRRATVELERLATVCDRRAEVCSSYTAEVHRHRSLVAVPGVPPSPEPVPPAWWVEP